METIIAIIILVCIIGGIVFYLYRAKKRQTCIGCPYCKQCGSKGACGSRENNHKCQHQ